MIDDKKIEEATRDYIDKNGYSLKYDEEPCVDIEFAYKDGAKWMREELLKYLCHTIEEKPNKGRVFLYKTRFGGYGVHQLIDENEWKYIQYREVTQWIYIDDIFQKEGDNHD